MEDKKEKEKKYLKLNDIADLIGVSRTTVWKIRQDPTFPVGKKISKQVHVWPRESVENWLEDKKKDGD